MRASLDLPVRRVSMAIENGPHGPLTAEQARAVDSREGRLLVAANAGAGKTMVLVERFVRDVLESAGGEDPIGCDQILAITFTRKAAGELRARIRERFKDLGAREQARDVERAWILTIDGFCLRLLRAHAVLAGLDPGFEVLEPGDSRDLRESAFAEAVDAWLGDHERPRADALQLLSAHGYDGLRDAITDIHETLRCAGMGRPRIPAPAPADRERAAAELAGAAETALCELRARGASGRTVDAVARGLEECGAMLARGAVLSPEAVHAWRPPRTANALKTPVFDACREAVDAYKRALTDELGAPQLEMVSELLDGYADRFAELKARARALDFTDLALRARSLLLGHPAVAAAYRRRLRRVMVDEFQDTNALQVSLIDALGVDHLFMVGDALQSIYGFRHADVAVFVEELDRRTEAGESASLADNFRSRKAILDVVNAAFGDAHEGVPWTPLAVPERGGEDERAPTAGAGPAVEFLATDESAWNEDTAHRARVLAGFPPSTRPAAAAEALLVAQRVRELVDSGEATAGEIVVLLRAGAKLPLFERAIERAGLPAVAAQGRGWWARLEVLDLIAHLRLLVNPRDEEGLCGALTAFGGLTHDALALLAMDRDAARRGGELHASLLDAVDRAVGSDAPGTVAAQLEPADRERLRRYRMLLDVERAAASWAGPAELLARVVAATGYDRAALSRPGGARRLANIRKLVRLAGEFERSGGGDLRAFVDHAAAELEAKVPTSDAPVEVGEDSAVRLMTIHAAKGLEFPVVVVADLGHRPPGQTPRVLVDGERAGLRVTTIDRRRYDALDYGDLKRERADRDRGEERRVIHVAVTRARRRLVLSGIAELEPGDGWGTGEKTVAPIRWMTPLMLRGDVLGRLGDIVDEHVAVERAGTRGELRVAVNAPRTLGAVLRLEPGGHEQMKLDTPAAAALSEDVLPEPTPAAEEPPPPAPATVSYSSLSDFAQCGYGWYLRRVLRLPRRETWDLRDVVTPALGDEARLRGTLAHALLERQPLTAGAPPPGGDLVRAVSLEVGVGELGDEQVADQQRLVRAFLDGPLRGRVTAAARVAREVAFSLALAPGDVTVPLLTGSIDLLAEEGAGAHLVIDYKTDRVDADVDLRFAVESTYALQRAAYALAALRAGATTVDVVHLYLERPDEPVSVTFGPADRAALEESLRTAAAELGAGRFPVSDQPYAGLCASCPGRGGLCSHPDEMTGRPSPA